MLFLCFTASCLLIFVTSYLIKSENFIFMKVLPFFETTGLVLSTRTPMVKYFKVDCDSIFSNIWSIYSIGINFLPDNYIPISSSLISLLPFFNNRPEFDSFNSCTSDISCSTLDFCFSVYIFYSFLSISLFIFLTSFFLFSLNSSASA